MIANQVSITDAIRATLMGLVQPQLVW